MILRAEGELLLCCARVRGDAETADRIRALLKEPIDWARLLRMARDHGVGPLLYCHLDTNAAEAVPVEVLGQLRDEFRANTRRNLLLTGELLCLLEGFRSASIPVVPFKGPTLASALYGSLGLREFTDLDLLIRPGDLGASKRLLLAHGYRPGIDLTGAQEEALLKHQYELPFVRSTDGTIVELQWRIVPRYFSLTLDFARFEPRLGSASLLGRPVLSLSPEDLLLVLCVHGTKHLWQRLGWVCDVGELLRVHVDLDWDNVLDTARRMGAERILLLGATLARSLLQAPVPEVISARIDADPALTALEQTVSSRMFGRPERPVGLVAQSWFHLKTRERLMDRVRYCMGLTLATTPGDWATVSLSDPLFAFYYPMRFLRLAVKYGVGVHRGPRPSDDGL